MSDAQKAQQIFWDAIHAGSDAPHAGGADHFRGDARLDAGGRLNIYAQMYEARLLEALQNDFPWTAALIGDTDDVFANTVRAYVRTHPLRSYTLAGVGERFPDFLAMRPGRADVADVARLEGLRNAVAVAADAPSLDVSALGAHGAEIVNMRCVFAPTMRHADVAHDVCTVVDALAEGSSPPAPASLPACLAAWRHDERVFHTALTGPAAEALRLAVAGASIAMVCEAFAGCAEPAQEAFAAIGAWFSDGWVERLEQVC